MCLPTSVTFWLIESKGPSIITHKYHSIENLIGINERIITGSKEIFANMSFVSKVEPKNVKEALTNE